MVDDFTINDTSRRRWEITGILATVVILLTVPLYVLKVKYVTNTADLITREPAASFVGREKCINCHQKEYEKWQNSHHDKAMDEANEKTVLGDFNDAAFEHDGITTRFYRKDNKFFVNTQGPGGEMGDFEITYTFGFYPLQQYLVPFSGGRLQSLPIAWDTKEKRWFRLPNGTDDPGDWLHWTKAAQNWNGMCAECHSTGLEKGFDYKTGTYNTTWSEIDVSCEACHGPGSRHVAWADKPPMARTQSEDYELVVRTGKMSSIEQVQLCAPCHSRRSLIGDYEHSGKDLMDNMVPTTLREGLYYPDGQILEEVYVYGSFVQSKMYRNGVRCGDCHDVHSIKLVKEGNDLCLQCHRADTYDSKDHHFHKKEGEEGEPIKSDNGKILFKVGEGAECVKCHMPGRYYMGNDYRPDHSIRIPRPDLSIELKTPNSCNRCHRDESDEWSADYTTKWYGMTRKPHYGTILAAGRKGIQKAHEDLIRLANDPLFPGIVRATALSLLRSYPDEQSTKALERALADEESLIRHTAISNLGQLDPKERIKLLAPMLYDPVKAVRAQAARNLTEIPTDLLDAERKKVFQVNLRDYQKAMEYAADFPHARMNLGNMYVNLRRFDLAEKHYRAAFGIDRLFYPAKTNLAMLYNSLGDNDKAERMFREVVKEHPNLHDVAYSLGLLLVEQGNYQDAAQYLKKAADGMPERARVHYNLGLLLQRLKRDTEAEAALKRAYETDMNHFDYLYALTDFYLKRSKLKKAKTYAEEMVAKHPDREIGHRLLRFIYSNLQPK
jgi:Tfp pilus assembly protein PilF